MYSRQEASRRRQEFWTVFGQYMMPVPSAEGEKANWINYKTGEKNILFKMQADAKKVLIGMELTHKDAGIRHLYFEQFAQFKSLLEQVMKEEWNWSMNVEDENGKPVDKIFMEEKGLNILKKEDWPGLISFFKPRIIGLDEFWTNVKYGFEALRTHGT